MTTLNINSAKKGAVYRCLNHIKKTQEGMSLEYCLQHRLNGNTTARICSAIVQTYDDYLEPKVKEKVTNEALVVALTDGLTCLMGKMSIY